MDHQSAIRSLTAVLNRDRDGLQQALNILDTDDLWQLKRIAEELSCEAENAFMDRPRD